MPSHSLYFDQIPEDALETARRRFFIEGESVADWARERGFSLQLTYSVLNGRLRARRGQSHRIAVALGLKPECSAAQAQVAASRAATMECAS
jgi:gp16 family phage-associated protein